MRIEDAQATRFAPTLTHAVEGGLVAAALVDRNGNVYRCKSADLASRLFDGEVLFVALDDRDVAVGVARRQLFVVAVLGASTPAMRALVRELRDEVERLLPQHDVAAPPLRGGGGGSGPGPAELPLIELGITVPRERGKA